MTDLSSTASERSGSTRAAARSAASAQLGGTLRSILVSPEDGFRGAYALADNRHQSGVRLPEGSAPLVMGACGGAALMMLWLKLGGLLGLRGIAPADFRWSYVVVAALGAAVLGALAQCVWGPVGRIALGRLGASTTAPRMRLAWGAAALPQVFALVILFPLDVMITGRRLFTAERITDTFPAIWGALSVAISVSLAAWSAYLFFRGVQTGSGASTSNVAIA
ncbi:MAG TPA: hypothetical protein VIG64_12770, partial [Actinomycetota bacterium]